MESELNNEELINQEQSITVGATSLADFGKHETSSSENAERIAQLERELQQERVEKGRLKTVNDELRQLKEEIKKLKAENSSLKQRKASDYLTEAERGEVDEGQLAVIDKIVQGRVGDFSEEQKAENDRLRAELAKRDASMAATKEVQFNAEVERLAPGLSAAVTEHKAEWQKWAAQPRRSASVISAFKNFDAATVADFLQEFAESKGIRVNMNGNAARPNSSFSPRGGNHPLNNRGDTTTYTLEEYNTEIRKASSDFNAGKITPDEYRAIKQKFDIAIQEGRVTQR